MTHFSDSSERIEGLYDDAEKRLRRAFLLAVDHIESQATIDQLTTLLEQGQVGAAVEVASAAWAGFAAEWVRVFVVSGESTAAFLDAEIASTFVTFDQTNFRATMSMQENRLRLVRELTLGQRDSIRVALVEGIQRGVGPRETARIVRESIGLTAHQMGIVNNYRRSLEGLSADALTRELRDRRFDRTIERAIRLDEPLTQDQISRMTTRYRDRWVAFRATMISRTESLSSVNEGNERMWDQAIEDGALNPDEIIKEWSTSFRNSRESHILMNRQQQPMGTDFTSGNGFRLRFPGDPRAPAAERIHCQCVVLHRVAAIVEAEREEADLVGAI